MFTKANLRPILSSSLAANFYSGYLTIIGIFLLALHKLRLVVKAKYQPIWQTLTLQAATNLLLIVLFFAPSSDFCLMLF